jgi:hypothetical protein
MQAQVSEEKFRWIEITGSENLGKTKMTDGSNMEVWRCGTVVLRFSAYTLPRCDHCSLDP